MRTGETNDFVTGGPEGLPGGYAVFIKGKKGDIINVYVGDNKNKAHTFVLENKKPSYYRFKDLKPRGALRLIHLPVILLHLIRSSPELKKTYLFSKRKITAKAIISTNFQFCFIQKVGFIYFNWSKFWSRVFYNIPDHLFN